LFDELSNFGWVNISAGEPSFWTPNNRHKINKWTGDPNVKINQYTDPNLEESTFETEPIHDDNAEISSQSQPQDYSFMPSFVFDPGYQSSFNPYMAPPQIESIQDYFGYISQLMYHLNLNQ
jgi:hypothetical protein